MANEKNLIQFDEMPPERQRELSSKGGKTPKKEKHLSYCLNARQSKTSLLTIYLSSGTGKNNATKREQNREVQRENHNIIYPDF